MKQMEGSAPSIEELCRPIITKTTTTTVMALTIRFQSSDWIRSVTIVLCRKSALELSEGGSWPRKPSIRFSSLTVQWSILAVGDIAAAIKMARSLITIAKLRGGSTAAFSILAISDKKSVSPERLNRITILPTWSTPACFQFRSIGHLLLIKFARMESLDRCLQADDSNWQPKVRRQQVHSERLRS